MFFIMDISLKSTFLLYIIFLHVLCINHAHQTQTEEQTFPLRKPPQVTFSIKPGKLNGIRVNTFLSEDATGFTNDNAERYVKSTSYFVYQRPQYPRDCSEVLEQCFNSQNASGVYLIKPAGFAEAFEVFCDHDGDSEGWTVIQRRFDGSLDFNRDWIGYKEGFGFLNSEFWLGNQKLSFMLNQKKYELRIQLVTGNMSSWYLSYDNVRINDEWGNYSLVSVGMCKGNADSHVTWCPWNMIYGNCPCQATCEDPRSEDGCHNTCTEEYACVCADGFLMRGSECIRKQDCDCFMQETGVLKNGESYISSDCSSRCSCDGNQLTCESYQCSTDETCQEVDGAYQCQCNDGFVKDGENCVIAADCKALYDAGVTTNGIYTIKPSGWSGSGFEVYCNMESNGGGWTVFQRRVDGTVEFYRNWTSYKQGFGSLTHEFWLGNDQIHAITKQRNYSLRIDAVQSHGKNVYTLFSTFSVASKVDKYRLSLGSYSGNTGTSPMGRNRGNQFSTHDEDNDGDSEYNCAQKHRGAWWYDSHVYNVYGDCFRWDSGVGSRRYHTCSDSNLNGDYGESGYKSVFFYDNRQPWRCAITRSEMKLR